MTTDYNFNTGGDLNVNFNSSSSVNSQFGTNNNSIPIMDMDSQHEINMNFSSNSSWSASFETGGSGGGESKVLYGSTEYWNNHRDIVAKRGYIYIYSDYQVDSYGRTVAGFKVGDGTSYLIDMPFTDSLFVDHINDHTIHITNAERLFWNNKVRCYIDPYNRRKLVFTTN